MSKVITVPANSIRELVTKKGQIVHTPLTDDQALNLFDHIPDTWNDSFLLSLKKQRSSTGTFSQDQMVYVHKWAIELLKDKVLFSVQIEDNSLIDIIKLFDRASKKREYPCIMLANDSQETIALSKHLNKSRYLGAIGIYGAYYKCLGRIEKSQKTIVLTLSEDCPKWIETAIMNFAKNPAESARSFAKATGRCCFCKTPLSDEELTRGYDATCGINYQLPWGNKRR